MSPLYRGSVKDLMGPVRLAGSSEEAVSFEYTDSYSVFDWGRMPDALARKGEALAVLAADLFERLEKADTWREFSRSPEALGLRKGNRFGAAFNEVGEELQSGGLRTHYLGLLERPVTEGAPGLSEGTEVQPRAVSSIGGPSRSMLVRRVTVVKPTFTTVLGRSLPDFFPSHHAAPPRLVPLEVVFRFSCAR
jgi:phosphoribosylaminoimidazole-succinocarboxamide synthase